MESFIQINGLKVERSRRSAHFLLIFIFIIVSDDTLLFGTNSNKIFITFKFLYIITGAIILLLMNLRKGLKIKHLEIFGYSGLIISILMSMAVNNDFRLGYFYKVCLLIYAFSIVKLIDFKEFVCIFNKIITFFALVSIFGYLIVLLYKEALIIFPIISNTAQNLFYFAGVFVSPISSYSKYIRNYGIFREPGVYQMYLIMALIFQNFVPKENSLFTYVILIFAVITTMSTTGYIALAIVLFLIFTNDRGLSYKRKSLLLFMVFAGILILLFYTDIFSLSSEKMYDSVFGKLRYIGRSTTIARFGSITENIKITFENPLFGAGITSLDALFPQYTAERYGISSVHNTNTFLIQFASHGIIYGLLWVFVYLRFSLVLNRKNALIIFLIILILYIGENLTYSGFASLFLAYGMGSKNKLNHDGWNVMCPVHVAGS